MAEIVEGDLPDTWSRAGERYPWETWFDGSTRALYPGADFECTVPSLRTAAHRAATRYGVRVKVRQGAEGTVLLQAYKPEAGQ